MNKILGVCVAALAMGSCTKSTETAYDPRAVEFSVGVETRVTADSEWELGDEVGIFAGDYSNKRYTLLTTSDDKSTGALRAITAQDAVKIGSEPMDYYAYYPYVEGSVEEQQVAMDISGDKNQPVMVASNTDNTLTEASRSTVNLPFGYKVAKLRLTIHEGVLDFSGGNKVGVTISGAATKGSLNVVDGTWSSVTEADIEQEVTIAEDGINEAYFDIYIIENGEQSLSVRANYRGVRYLYNMAATTFTAGESYPLTVYLINEPPK